METKLKVLKKTIIALNQTDNYYETKAIIENLYKYLCKDNLKTLTLRIKCIKAKRKLRQGFLGKLDDSRREVGKLICEIQKVINSVEKN